MACAHARSRTIAVVLAALPACVGCADVVPEAAETLTVRDSAGIRIVENGAEAVSRWSLDPEPTVVIGARDDDPNAALFRVGGATVLGDGRIAVAVGAAPMLRWFGPDGTFLSGAGRAGEGPGEFGGEGAWIYALWGLAGDSVATWEHGPRRMQVFDPDGAWARSVVIDPPAPGTSGYPQIVGRWDGGFVAFRTPPAQPGTLGEIVRDPLPYTRYDADGRELGVLATLPGYTRYTFRWLVGDGQERNVTGRPPFAHVAVAAVGGDRFAYSDGDAHEVAVWDTSGARTMIIRQAMAPRAVTPQHVDRYVEDQMTRAPDDPAARRAWERTLADSPYPGTLPTYRALRIDRSGTIWAAAFPPPGAGSATWYAFDRDGTWVGELEVPVDWTVLEFGVDHVLALVRNELDVETVQRFALGRR